MRYLALTAVAVLSVVLLAAQTFAQNSVELTCQGEAPVISGNVAHARTSALSMALKGAVNQAARNILGREPDPQAMEPILSRADAYVLSYRVLAEGQDETAGMYSLEAQALVSVDGLHRALRNAKLLTPLAALPTVRPVVDEALGTLTEPEAEELLTSVLRGAGFAVETGPPQPQTMTVSARLKRSCPPAGACMGQASLKAMRGGKEVAQRSVVATANTAGEALIKAARDAAAGLASALKQDGGLSGQVLVRALGLARPEQLDRLREGLAQMGLSPRLTSLKAGEAVISVSGAGGGESLARLISERQPGGLSLSVVDKDMGTVTVRLLP